ncbi:MAG: DUF167 domain-containing protein [Candidatus Thorarchaeota archaeon]
MTEEWIWESEKGTFLVVVVRPGSKERELVHTLDDSEIVLNLSSPARDGKANTELIKRLSKSLDLSSLDIVIAAGHKAKKKTLILQHISQKELLERLSKLHNG